MSTVPKTHHAVVLGASKSTSVQEVAVPGRLNEGYDLLVKVSAVALNPTDWKHIHAQLIKEGAHTGSDFAGVVVEAAGGFKEGDRVAGFTRGGALHNENGAFAEYVRANPAIVWRLPASTSFEEGAAIGGIPVDTAAQALFDPKRLGLSDPTSPTKSGEWVLIWSGATAVGWYAIQLAKAAGYKVVTVASPKNHQTLKGLGADEVFDYNDKEAPKKIREVTGDALKYGLDTISENGSVQTAQQAFGKDGGKIVTLLPAGKNDSGFREEVTIKHTLIYSVLQKEKFAGDQEENAKFHSYLPDLVASGKLKSIKVTKREGGLAGIWDGLEHQRAGKVSAEKLVYTIA